VDEIRNWTQGEGVDVVLNSLSGELIEKSLGLLREDGRFVEIGKRDYLANAQLGLRPFLKNLSYTLVDLLGMTRRAPARVGAVLQEVMGLVEQGILEPLPCRSFGLGEAVEAFRTMAQARHIGKLVLRVGEASGSTQVMERVESASIRGEGTYLLTGGLGGLGLSLARSLAERGARHLVLVGRSGAESGAQREAVAALRHAGVEVLVASADVASRTELEQVFAQLKAAGWPALRGVIHAAGVLEDGLLLEQDGERFAKVMAPKVAGAWNLHELTRGLPLDFFVMYSSGASLLGSAGQGNYAAANAFLDGLAHYRRARGLCALSINWGAFTEVGLAAAQENRASRLAHRGLRSLAPQEGAEIFSELLSVTDAQVGVLPMDFRHWVSFAPHLASSTLLSELTRAARPASRGDRELRAALLEAPEEARRAQLIRYVVEQVAQVTRLDPNQIDANTAFKSLGIDSLMGLELRNRLEAALGLKLSATLIWNYPNATALGQHLSTKLAPPSPATPAALPASPALSESTAAADKLSLSETERLFEQQLAALEESLQ
jgi:NAD(P)-dependent dehydrogenase (short-subunit alcohol dehydrogenase family)/acyl carrier protein